MLHVALITSPPAPYSLLPRLPKHFHPFPSPPLLSLLLLLQLLHTTPF